MTAWQRAMDTRAFEMATETRAEFREHQRECKDRYVESDRKLTEIRLAMTENQNQIYGFLWRGMAALVTLLLAIIGYMVNKGGLPGAH